MSPPRACLALVPAILLLALLASTAPAGAQSWAEGGDAGNLPANAEITYGTGPLTTIVGGLANDMDVDMYCIQVTDPVAFGAYLACATLSQNDIWIFSPGGIGIARDRGCQGGQTRVGAPLVTTAGFYYLAVSGNDALAQNAGSDLWLAGTPITGQAAPNGPAAALPVSGWTGGLADPLAYTIQLVGAGYCDVPLPTRSHTWGATKLIYR